MELTSPAFDDGDAIPHKHGYTQDNISPPLEISDVPSGTVSLALVVDDPDAKEPAGKIWDHWLVWNISAGTETIEEDSVPSNAVEGKNDYGEQGYGGPNPPDREHTYRFTLYALDTELDLDEDTDKDGLRSAMEGHILGRTGLTGTFRP